ncbi:MAG: hypothetical protein R3357_14220, partial [Burkholderiales bacterium]|nr:hypothetical protein [Burkholderiales bacterium]
MDRAAHLAALNGALLHAFSRRSLETLHRTSALRLVLPHVEPLLVLNVGKEVRKDALAFRAAAEAVARGRAPDRQDAERLLEATKAIDREFLRRMDDFPVRLEISYARVAPVRLRRIERLLEAAHRLLAHWPPRTRLRAVIQAQYAPEAFEQLLCGLLRLYAEEACALARAVRLPRLLAPLTERLA